MIVKIKLSFSIILSLVLSVIFINSCGKKSVEGLIIITLVDNIDESSFSAGDSCRYTGSSRLAVINPDKPEKSPEIITSGFFSACSPEVSYDGKYIIFSAQKNENDKWHIWEMNLKNNKYRLLTSSSDNCIDPAYLPGERVVFSKYIENDSLKGEYSLFTCNLDGTDLKRITFNPHTYFASSVLNDGRLITISRQIFPTRNKQSVMVLRPDGTKSELFYQGAEGTVVLSRGHETEDGRVVFIESENLSEKRGSVVSIDYNRPLHSRINLTSSVTGDFNSVIPSNAGKFLVSFRPSEIERYALYEFYPEKLAVGDLIYRNDDYDVVDAIYVSAHTRQKKLPSEVDMGVKTGQLLCQNINITGMQSPETSFTVMQATRIEIIGIDSSLGVVDVEKDGSFYLKVAADMPFSIKTLDNKGKVVNGPGCWIWLRPNERRGCTGCHEDQEMVPANRYSLAVKKNPVLIPVHIEDIIEKEVELE